MEARMHRLQGNEEQARQYHEESERIAGLILRLLWDEDAQFFKVMRHADVPEGKLADVRELLGYLPWYYSIPPKGQGFERAWGQLMDPDGFYAPYGLTTAEQRHPGFKVVYEGHDCQWNGPSWPYATALTLTAMANVLQDYPQTVISRSDYVDLFLKYTNSHQLQTKDGATVPWIDENLNPYTGDWIARTMLMSKGAKPGERGKDYNHSTYIDLLITGLIGLKPRCDDVLEVDPLLPKGRWDYFCLDQVPYHDRQLTIIWDSTGRKYPLGKGFIVLVDGREIARADGLSKIEVLLGD
jgi:hypothetical protein